MAKKKPINWDELHTAVITGASSGLGKDFAQFLTEKGINLVIVARRVEKLNEIKKQLEETYKIQVEVIPKDLSVEADIKDLAELISNRDDIDILINNAGFGVKGRLEDLDIQRAVSMLKVHNLAPLYLTHAILPNLLKKDRGFIINTSSLASFMPSTNGLYSSTKMFLIVLSRSLHLDLRKTNIRIQALCPGFFHSEFHDGEYKGLKDNTPKILFKPSKEVMEASIKGLEKDKTIVVPGYINRFGRYLFTNKLIGKKVVKLFYKKDAKS